MLTAKSPVMTMLPTTMNARIISGKTNTIDVFNGSKYVCQKILVKSRAHKYRLRKACRS